MLKTLTGERLTREYKQKLLVFSCQWIVLQDWIDSRRKMECLSRSRQGSVTLATLETADKRLTDHLSAHHFTLHATLLISLTFLAQMTWSRGETVNSQKTQKQMKKTQNMKRAFVNPPFYFARNTVDITPNPFEENKLHKLEDARAVKNRQICPTNWWEEKLKSSHLAVTSSQTAVGIQTSDR